MSTTDPGIEDTIKNRAGDVEPKEEEQKDGAVVEDDMTDLHDPSRWWFASTACPLLAGTFGPIATGFSVCALVYHWRVYIPPGGSESAGEKITDPPWLLAVNAVSLVAALVGNASLLLNMGRRLRFSIAQPITITGFFLAGLLLICDMAVMTSSPTYLITEEKAMAPENHALSQAFYYAVFAAAFYIIIAALMCLTVYGANKGHYDRSFNLTMPQRTLMLQTMSFIVYMLLGSLVFSKVEGWDFLNAVYFADVTLLTVGLGDFSPATRVGRGLLFPFAIGGILIVGLVVGSIRTLVLDRGKEKLSARLTEKRRAAAVESLNVKQQTIKISPVAKTSFNAHQGMSPAQRREEEFRVVRKIQTASERERRYMALAMSSSFALFLWFAGSAIFMVCEKNQEWTYFQSLYFAYYSLLTIGYGDFSPESNSGRPFFVLWSLLAVPGLTILISDMGDTVVNWVSDLTIWLGEITVLPGDNGAKSALKQFLKQIKLDGIAKNFTGPGLFGDSPEKQENKSKWQSSDHDNAMLDRLSERLSNHVEQDELEQDNLSHNDGDQLLHDIEFYHYVLARECRNVQKDLNASPPKEYNWADWEYFIKLMGNEDDPKDFPGQKLPDILVPQPLRMTKQERVVETRAEGYSTGSGDESSKTEPDMPKPVPSDWKQDWSWLSDESPLISTKAESEWILERLSAALERELNRLRKGYRRKPPISYSELRRHLSGNGTGPTDTSAAGIEKTEESKLDRAAKSSA